jgi:hypothetical protein
VFFVEIQQATGNTQQETSNKQHATSMQEQATRKLIQNLCSCLLAPGEPDRESL